MIQTKFNLKKFFPENFTPRPSQLEALDKIDNIWSSGKKYVIACMPTGIGKSHIGLSIANSSSEIDNDRKEQIVSYYHHKMNQNNEYYYDLDNHDKPNYGCYLLTITKSLQDQYKELFPDISLFKGKNNYQCQVDLETTADYAPCIYSRKLKQKCFDSCICPYYESKNKSLYSKTSILNYKSFFNLRPFLRKRQIIICDEADGIEEELVSQFTIEINYSFLKSCGITFKKIKENDTDKAKVWLFDVYNQILDELTKAKKKANLLAKENGFSSLQEKQIQIMNKLSKLQSNLNTAIQYWDECNYLIEEMKADKIVFTPYDIRPLFKDVFDESDRVLLMSATLSNHKQFANNMGLSSDEYEYIELDSPFNPDKSPIYCSNRYSLSYNNKNKDLDSMIEACLQICKQHKDHKGIIHTHTNFITQELFKKLKDDKRFLFKSEEISNEMILTQHKLSDIPTVLISPSLDTGISLDGDLGRFQIIMKAPYLPLSSNRIKKKLNSNPDQYSYYMLNTLVQMAGRCTRSKDDFSITYILDGNATKAIMQNKTLLPKHFLKRIH